MGGRALAAPRRPGGCGQGCRGGADRSRTVAEGSGGQAARELQRLQPDEVRSWTSAPPFPARTTYIPMIGAELARIRGLGEREWMALQDRVLLVVYPGRDLDADNGWVYGFAKLYSAPPATPRRIRWSRPIGRAGRSWWRGISSCPGCSTSRCTSCVSVRVVRRSACRSPAAKQARGCCDPTVSHAECRTLGRARPLLAACSGRRSPGFGSIAGCAGPRRIGTEQVRAVTCGAAFAGWPFRLDLGQAA